MKKLIAIIVTVSLAALVLAACGGKKEEQQPASQSGEEEQQPASQSGEEEPGMLAGGWQLNDATGGCVTEEAQAAFDKAMEELTGADYEIYSLLGTQVVAGTNYEFFCKETPVVPNAVPKTSIVVVYADLQGNAKVTNVEEFDIGTFYGATNPSDEKTFEQLAGGWSIPENVTAASLPEPVASVYAKAMENESGITPVAYIGSQVVAGTNYAVLGFDENAPCMVYLYAPLQGDPEITSIYKINMGEFSGN